MRIRPIRIFNKSNIPNIDKNKKNKERRRYCDIDFNKIWKRCWFNSS